MILMQSKREFIQEEYPEVLLLDPEIYDDAIIGIVEAARKPPVVCYDKRKIIDILMQRDKMNMDEALEFFKYKMLGSYVGEHTPMFVEVYD